MTKKDNPHLFQKLFSFRILTITVGNWLVILLFLSSGVFVFSRIQEEVSSLPEERNVTAEIIDMWIQTYDDEAGGRIYHRFKLREQNTNREYKCTVSPVASQLWQELKIGKTYELSLTVTTRRCYVQQAKEVEEDQPFVVLE